MADEIVVAAAPACSSSFPGRVQVGQTLYYAFFTTLWVKRSPFSDPLPGFCFLFALQLLRFFPPKRPIPFFHSGCKLFLFLVFVPRFFAIFGCGQCSGGVKEECQEKQQNRKRESLTTEIPR